ncbi:uncharacterized protein LOC117641206 [Thrips palmi]|uniref:Uncharacterized protein LOC117641206 n=1 Tax=Thrips palmi TaxID=161013 RepID=A0A6P8YBR6_THRPL|nr:uncharacterized protein LOC117641206 [Thrips palmi]
MDPKSIALLQIIREVTESSSSEEDIEDQDSSSSSEDEASTLKALAGAICLTKKRGPLNKRPQIEGYVENIVPKYTDAEFKSHFRLLPATFEYVLELIGPRLHRVGSTGRPQTPARTQLLMALWMMATPNSYRSVHSRFNVGKATSIRIMRRVSKALHEIAPRFIQWPQGERAARVTTDFEKHSAFPGAIGAIDGTHVEIKQPQDDQHQAYVNRKGYPSIQIQAVCTHDLQFTSVYAGHAGSVHDARVFRLSPVAQYVTNPDVYFPNDSHLIGDAAYGIHPHIMVPFKDDGHLTARQKNFNFCLSSARVSIERAFGVWKGRWRSVLECFPMVKIENIPEYLVATMVLHNICIMRNDLIEYQEMPEDLLERGILLGDRKIEGKFSQLKFIGKLGAELHDTGLDINSTSFTVIALQVHCGLVHVHVTQRMANPMNSQCKCCIVLLGTKPKFIGKQGAELHDMGVDINSTSITVIALHVHCGLVHVHVTLRIANPMNSQCKCCIVLIGTKVKHNTKLTDYREFRIIKISKLNTITDFHSPSSLGSKVQSYMTQGLDINSTSFTVIALHVHCGLVHVHVTQRMANPMNLQCKSCIVLINLGTTRVH